MTTKGERKRKKRVRGIERKKIIFHAVGGEKNRFLKAQLQQRTNTQTRDR